MKDEGWSKDFDDNEQHDNTDRQLDNTLSASRAWMEIYPENSTSRLGYLQVGEQALLTIKCTLPGKRKKWYFYIYQLKNPLRQL